MKSAEKVLARQRRHRRVRRKISGTALRPRLSVYRSLRHVYVQLIDDESGKTLASASSLTGAGASASSNVSTSVEIGRRIAEQAKQLQIEQVVFDRGGYLYHGCVKALAEAAREGGLKF
jgi:large subunit ribosomal protein L18